MTPMEKLFRTAAAPPQVADPVRDQVVRLTAEWRLIRRRRGPGWPEKRAALREELVALQTPTEVEVAADSPPEKIKRPAMRSRGPKKGQA